MGDDYLTGLIVVDKKQKVLAKMEGSYNKHKQRTLTMELGEGEHIISAKVHTDGEYYATLI